MRLGFYWLSWFVFLLSALMIVLGGLMVLKTGQNRGIYMNYLGFIGLSVAGFFMTVACGVFPKGG